METRDHKEGAMRNPETVKWDTFYEITRSALFGINMAKQEGVKTFTSGGKEHAVTSVAGAVKAFGQISASVMGDVYKKAVQG